MNSVSHLQATTDLLFHPNTSTIPKISPNQHQLLTMAATTTKTATPKAANGTVKKAAGPGRPKGVGKKNNARTAMAKMQAYCKCTKFDALCRVIWTRSSAYSLTNNNSQSSPRRVQGSLFQRAAARTRQEGEFSSATFVS
jgi:hypothetical protein